MAALSLSDPGRSGELDLYEPIATYWPEFAAAGKETVADPSRAEPLRRPVRVGRSRSPGGRCSITTSSSSLHAAQAPWWEPGFAVRLSRDQPGVPARRGRQAGVGTVARHVLRRRGRRPARRRLPHRHRSGARLADRPRDPTAEPDHRLRFGRQRLDRLSDDEQHARRRRVLVDESMAPRGDPRRRRPRQRPLGRAVPHTDRVRRHGERCDPAVGGGRGPDLRRAAAGRRPRARCRHGARDGLRPPGPDAARPEPAHRASGADGAARSPSSTSTRR